MYLFDVLFTIGPREEFLSLTWGGEHAALPYRPMCEHWVEQRHKIFEVLPLPDQRPGGSLVWNGEQLAYLLLPAPEGKQYLLLSWNANLEFLYTRALDQLPFGVQIYDKNTHAVYFNQASREISHIPSGVNITGRHLLDMYDLEETVSTTMTALRTQSPVIDRVDQFSVDNGTFIASANTSYPIFQNGQLSGAVTFEHTEETIQKYYQSIQDTRQALKHFSGNAAPVRFSGYTFENVIGGSEKLRSAAELAQRVAPQNSPVMLVGETGTGKEIFAQSIHRSSPRAGKKFVAINCAAIPETLIESLLFGTAKGSFTGSEDKAGYFEEANGGTLFLDELNSMSLVMQSKLLRVLQERTFRRVGGKKDLELDVRIISSCNEDPFQTVEENKFRRDLFYRLSSVIIELPPLREHLEDLEQLTRYHLEQTAFQYVHRITRIQPQVYQLLRAYRWPGNVRELFHVLDYAQNVADSDVMTVEHLPAYLRKNQAPAPRQSAPPTPSGHIDFSHTSLQALMDDYEKEVITQALDHCGYNISQTAQALGILRQSLQYRIRKYGIIF
ncbi:sigma 54-interacting transcriptional regulator [Lawsonibacter sp. DFI.6.74]|nr:sigma 54-interacting transcriptional regulator [Lawsonibacter sp. DFI.6.74]MCG4774701.1 sigma 54-interacting transcriptional regulator [Lawsonibacter sp. DFI.5.51]